jgi:hypothetical protein
VNTAPELDERTIAVALLDGDADREFRRDHGRTADMVASWRDLENHGVATGGSGVSKYP